MKNIIGLSISLLFLVSVLLSSCSDVVDQTPEKKSAVERPREPAPDFTLQDSGGQDVTLSEFEGKVVLLNFWATWCGPCKIEMPWFLEFQQKYRDQGFTVIAISMDEEGWGVVRPFLKDLKPNFPVVIGDDEIAQKFGGVVALPTTFIIDKEGNIASTHQGLVSKNKYEKDIRQLL